MLTAFYELECFYLLVSAWVTNNKQSWFLESRLNLIGKGTRREASRHSCSSSVACKL